MGTGAMVTEFVKELTSGELDPGFIKQGRFPAARSIGHHCLLEVVEARSVGPSAKTGLESVDLVHRGRSLARYLD
jgi:hypothetical protein